MKIRKQVIEIIELTKKGKVIGYYWDCLNCSDEGDRRTSYREAMKGMKKHFKECCEREQETDSEGDLHLPCAVFMLNR